MLELRSLLILLALSAVTAFSASAKEPPGEARSGKNNVATASAKLAANCAPATATTEVKLNNVRFTVNNCRTSRKTDLYGDENLWWVFKDKGNIHTETGSNAIGMEVRAQAFAFNSNDEVANMSFYNYELINRSTFTLTETVRRFDRDDPTITSVDWDLKNQDRVPVASGAYLLHVNAPDVGERVLKLFCIMRPPDLDSF